MARVLVVGAGGREHALVRALLRGQGGVDLLAAPGNIGIARDGVRCLDIGVDDHAGLVAAASDEGVDLAVVGPEAPLVAGLVDMLGDAGIRAFGPTGAAARIEGSKAYAKELMHAASVPTAAHSLARTREEAIAALARYPVVLKADALAQGKGVIVCADEREAIAALDIFFGERRFGATRLIIEEFLEGEELSLLALCDGVTAVPMAPARDYKRIFDGDRGPNTGGMGSYSPTAEPASQDLAALSALVHQPIVDELRLRGTPFHGVLYAGLMLTPAGPRVLEYNCRFGDPETQAVLPRLRSDLLQLLEGSVRAGGLADTAIEWSPEQAVTVVLASAGYPGRSSTGDTITGLAEAAATGAEVLHAGTAEREGELVTAGGRVLSVTGLGGSLGEARERAYGAADLIDFNGRQLRRDIALGVVEEVGA